MRPHRELAELHARLPDAAREATLADIVQKLPPAVRRDLTIGASTLDQSVGEVLIEDDDFTAYFTHTMRRTTQRRLVAAFEIWNAQEIARAPESAWEGGPPLTPAGIRAFAENHGLAGELLKPVEVLRDAVHETTWWRFRYLHDRPIGSAMAESRAVLRAAALHLRNASIRPRQLRERIERLTNGAASPALTELAHRVNARLVALAFPEPPPPYDGKPRFAVDLDERAVTVEDPTYLWRGQVSLLDRDANGAMIATNAFEHHALVRVLLERTIDAIFDPDDELHAPLRTALEAPAWEQFMLRVRAATEPPPIAEREEERVAWRITLRGAHPSLDPLVQKRGKRGWSPGAVKAVELLWHEPSGMLDEHDERVLYALGRPPTHARDTIGGIVALAGHPRVVIGSDPVQVRTFVPELVVLEDDDELYRVALRIGGELLMAGDAVAAFVQGGLLYDRLDRGELWAARTEPALRTVLELAARYAVAIPKSAGDELVVLLGRMPAGVGIELPPSLAGRRLDPSSKLVLRLEPLPASGLFARIFARPLGVGPRHPPGEGPLHLVGVDAGARVHTARDFGAERHAAEELVAALGLDRAVHEGTFGYRIDEADDAVRLLELLTERPELAIVEWPDDASAWSIGEIGDAGFVVASRGADYWLDAKSNVGDQRVELASLLRAMRAGKKYVQIGPRRFVKLAEQLRSDLEALAPVLHLEKDGVRAGAEAIALIEEVLGARVEGDAEWRALRDRLRESRDVVPAMPPLEAELRDYQIDGVRWLLSTARWARGVCLADEMGLGKTVQTIALLSARASLGPSLVVCPTSISDNWHREHARFAPHLHAIVYRGAGRSERIAELGPNDVVITSYDVLARDVEVLEKIELSTLVLDEAQAIKNPTALRTAAVKRLSAGFRVALTGTPIENRLSELFSLFTILTPGLLGSWDEFRARFAVPIERDGDLERLAQLRRLLRPFLLRRTKAQVARELPPRIEVVRTVDLSEAERALYESERREALDAIEKRRGDPQLRFVLLGRLTRMRRLVCDPSLVVEGSTVRSSKIEELLSLMSDLRREDHRALVFSQFTTLLARVCAALDARAIPYLYLDGSTPAGKRAELVDRWQSGNDPFFLISLKAGGTGLNLTAADYVVHLDPWWNPAVEDQASDRAHRIGQTKPVTIVRLVAQGTIEERVLELHEQKRRLASGLLEGSDENAAIDTDALIDLLGEGERTMVVRKRAAR